MLHSDHLPRPYRIFAIALLALAAYWPTLRLGFLWDDHVMIEGNAYLTEWSARTLKHDFTTDVFDGRGDPYYRPAQTVLNRLDYTLWKLRPFGYHLTNWLGHAANAVLIGELAMALGLGSLAALLAGCLFAVHPIGVEQLMIVAGRAEIFSLTFILASLLFLLRREKWEWGIGYLCFTMALLFKESAIIAPLYLAALLIYRRAHSRDYRRLVPFFLISLPYLVLRHAAVGSAFPAVSLGTLLLFFAKAFPHILLIYLQLLFVPWNLHSHRMVPPLSDAWLILMVLVAALPLILIKKKMRLALLAYVWFIVSFLPKIPVMIFGNFTLDHFAYSALVGIVLLLAAGYTKLWMRRHVLWTKWLGMSFFPLLIFWALLVHLNVQLRGTDEKMYRWALHFTGSHPIKYNLGVLLLTTGRPMEAIPYFEDVRALYPDDANNLHALALAYWQTGHPKTARLFLQQDLKMHPGFLPAAQSLRMINRLEHKL